MKKRVSEALETLGAMKKIFIVRSISLDFKKVFVSRNGGTNGDIWVGSLDSVSRRATHCQCHEKFGVTRMVSVRNRQAGRRVGEGHNMNDGVDQ